MSAKQISLLFAEPNACLHRRQLTSVPATRHVCGTDPSHQATRSTERLALTQITIQIQPFAHDHNPIHAQTQSALLFPGGTERAMKRPPDRQARVSDSRPRLVRRAWSPT